MKILFICDPLEDFNIKKDSTFAMMQEAQRRHFDLYVCQVHHLVWRGGSDVEALVQPLKLTVNDETPLGSAKHAWYSVQAEQPQSLRSFDAVLMRKDPPFDIEYLTATYLLEIAERSGARIFNKPEALRNHPEKLAIAEFSQFIVPTLVSRHAEVLQAFHAEHHDIILKPLDGMGGQGVFRVTAEGMNLGSVLEMLGHMGARSIMAQRFIPDIKQGDKRILLIGGETVPYALARIPKPGEVRGNLAVGGTAHVQPLTARDREIAETIAPVLNQRGVFLVGLDIIGDYLTEINVTSPTGFQQISQNTECNVAEFFWNALERAL